MARDFERHAETAKAYIQIAMIKLHHQDLIALAVGIVAKLEPVLAPIMKYKQL